LKIAALTRALGGETENGDGYLLALANGERPMTVVRSEPERAESRAVLDFEGDGGSHAAFLLVVDGIGHGPEAALVARKVIDIAERHHDYELERLARACHDAALDTRGAALGIARIARGAEELQFLGVGNVAIQVCTTDAKRRSPKSSGIFSLNPAELGVSCRQLAANSGIVGYRIPTHLRAFSCDYHLGDVVAMYSDGITRKFDVRTEVVSGEPDAEVLAKTVMARYATHTDDVTVVVLK